jgi:hypothetical protein
MTPPTTITEGRPPSELHGYWRLAEPQLAFDPNDQAQTTINPLAGLAAHGPFSARSWTTRQQPIRVALLAPKADLAPLRRQLNELVRPQKPTERTSYVPPWPGFQRVFGIDLAPAAEAAQIGLGPTLDQELAAASLQHRRLAELLIDGLRRLITVRNWFDVVVFYLPPRYSNLFQDPDDDFDLHAVVKAFAAQHGLTTQIITERALRYRCRASVAWRLGTALYAKAGGTPWKLDTRQAPLNPATAYIGLSYALRSSHDRSTSFVTCCSQVFDADGGGMEFVAYDVGQGKDLRNPYLSRDDMRLVMSRSLALYQDRHAGRTPRHLIVHKQTPFSSDETAGCLDAWGAASDLTCLTITRPAWRGVSLDAPRHPGERSTPSYAVRRGTTLQLDDRSCLLWVAGNAPDATLSGTANYLQGGKGTPRPLLLTRDAGRGPLDEAAAQVLALSKMNWNNDALHDTLPCTIHYAKVLATTLKYMPHLAPQPYDYRFFM